MPPVAEGATNVMINVQHGRQTEAWAAAQRFSASSGSLSDVLGEVKTSGSLLFVLLTILEVHLRPTIRSWTYRARSSRTKFAHSKNNLVKSRMPVLWPACTLTHGLPLGPFGGRTKETL